MLINTHVLNLLVFKNLYLLFYIENFTKKNLLPSLLQTKFNATAIHRLAS